MCQYAKECVNFNSHPRNSKKCNTICSINPTLDGDIVSWKELKIVAGKKRTRDSWMEKGMIAEEEVVAVPKESQRRLTEDEYDDLTRPQKRGYRELIQESGFKQAQAEVIGETLPAPVSLKKQNPTTLRKMADDMEAQAIVEAQKEANMREATEATTSKRVPKRKKKVRK